MRKSQIKFQSQDLTLNVIRCSTFGQGYFNRSLILLLSCLGVPDPYFLQKQRQATELVDARAIKERLAIALGLYHSRKALRFPPASEDRGNPESAEVSDADDCTVSFSQEQVSTLMKELYTGLLRGRKFNH